jgi:hypothetical protein
MKKYIQLFSNGTLNYTVNFLNDVKNLKIFEKDHVNFLLNKKQKIQTTKSFSYSSKYKSKYF